VTHIILIRGINVGGQRKMPMADLRALCEGLGWEEVRTYIQSGNVIIRSDLSPIAVEAALESSIAEHFGYSTSVVVRDIDTWASYTRTNPFHKEARIEPNRVMLGLAKSPPLNGAADVLRERAVAGERINREGDALWIHFPQGAGTSKLSPAVLERAAGSPVTMRNWRTVLKLYDMAVS
jgi:uncharacterized protein (DUF1697 family)